MKKVFTRFSVFLLLVYVIICTGVYFMQEHLIFFPQRLSDNYQFSFNAPFEELSIKSPSGNQVNGLLFRADSSKGIVIYFHGNAGSLESWGSVAEDFLPLHFSVLITDYPGYGKSRGNMSEQNLFTDAQAVYDYAKSIYPENEIIIFGRSIGTGVAAHLASENKPKRLILESPYFSMKDLSSHLYPFLPSFILRYPLRTDLFLPKIKCPVTVFHGTDDEVIYSESSSKLKALFKPGDNLYFIQGGHHNDLDAFEEFRDLLDKTLQW